MISRTSRCVVLALVCLSNAAGITCFTTVSPSANPFASNTALIQAFSLRGDTHGVRLFSCQSNSGDVFLVNTKYPPVPSLTILLPAYNEVQRIGETIEAYQSYLAHSNEWKGRSQILVVDDGSSDGTADFVSSYKSDDEVGIICVSLPQNEGKGAAISFGIWRIVANHTDSTCLVLIADADGSGDISSLDNMVKSLGNLIASQPQPPPQQSFWNSPALIVGNRGYEGTSLGRSILRWGFRTTVRILCGDLRVRDSQCGFKLLTLEAAERLYGNLHLKRWSHDVEVLFRAREWNIPISEETVQWQDKEGSKLVTSTFGAVQVSIVMLLDVFRMRLEYLTGRWELEEGS